MILKPGVYVTRASGLAEVHYERAPGVWVGHLLRSGEPTTWVVSGMWTGNPPPNDMDIGAWLSELPSRPQLLQDEQPAEPPESDPPAAPSGDTISGPGVYKDRLGRKVAIYARLDGDSAFWVGQGSGHEASTWSSAGEWVVGQTGDEDIVSGPEPFPLTEELALSALQTVNRLIINGRVEYSTGEEDRNIYEPLASIYKLRLRPPPAVLLTLGIPWAKAKLIQDFIKEHGLEIVARKP